jgi:hypothetical protein
MTSPNRIDADCAIASLAARTLPGATPRHGCTASRARARIEALQAAAFLRAERRARGAADRG